MQITATEAKNRFGYVFAQTKAGPVVVEKDGRPDSVIVSYADFQALTVAAKGKSAALRQREFNETCKECIAIQNADFEQNGLWCEGLVPRGGAGLMAQFDVYAHRSPVVDEACCVSSTPVA